MEIKLSQPITAHGETIDSITLREPTGGDFIDIGHPLNINSDESFYFRMDVIAKYIVRLGKIPSSAVREISPNDLQKIALEVASFLGETDSAN